ncbi:MAG TPA: hypothetical protein VMJ93_15285 [Verrucomicrobiae bacterium]|nr:hypothetical protein [Verrucomicrobiae bacterium]
MILLGKIAVGVGASLVVSAGLLCSDGFVRVDVREAPPDAHHIVVIAPALLAPIGLHFVPPQKLEAASQQIRPWMPAVRAGIAALQKQDDMTIVEVAEPDEHVLVRKEGGDIAVNVTDEGENVYVRAPIRAISSSLEEIAAAGKPGKT